MITQLLQKFLIQNSGYEEVQEATDERGFREVYRQLLCPTEGLCGMQIPAGAWHTINVIEPSIIFEVKDGAYVPG